MKTSAVVALIFLAFAYLVAEGGFLLGSILREAILWAATWL